MAAEQRKLLQQLMGTAPGMSTKGHSTLSVSDPKVCRSFLVGTCPHDLFTNTKQDLGPCAKVHNDGLKSEYEGSTPSQKAKWGFEFDYARDMEGYIGDCDRRIETAQRRLEKTPEEIKQANDLHKQISDLSKTIDTLLLEVSILGETGSVATSLTEMHKIRTLKLQKEASERDLKNLQDTSGPSGHQKLQVCDVCGAYLSRLDNDRRLADHFFGKMHMGYSEMRKTFKKLSSELKGRRPPSRQFEDDDPYAAGNRNRPPQANEYRAGGYGGYGGGGYGGGGYGGGGGGYGRGGRGGRRGGRSRY
ncbi:U1 snRNP splicing complex subunit [Penicillium taxi]|uniref:U1 snRNP splicing complex subunit n=1 Tax=Penicillium taxi TaxID=168475 RepID=UPI002545037F|nr:U1 snRNP splicing complex subunit [Penicillium taxi]KAJ5899384.1 U1 snRNP splicing complex subunit [Penicillium taxi]